MCVCVCAWNSFKAENRDYDFLGRSVGGTTERALNIEQTAFDHICVGGSNELNSTDTPAPHTTTSMRPTLPDTSHRPPHHMMPDVTLEFGFCSAFLMLVSQPVTWCTFPCIVLALEACFFRLDRNPAFLTAFFLMGPPGGGG